MNSNLKTTNEKKTKNVPEKKFISGGVIATIWKNSTIGEDGRIREYRTVSFEKRYKDKDGNWKSASSLRLNDIPKANLILSKTYEYLSMKNNEITQQ